MSSAETEDCNVSGLTTSTGTMDSTKVRSKRRVPVTVSASSFKGSAAAICAAAALWPYPEGTYMRASTVPNMQQQIRVREDKRFIGFKVWKLNRGQLAHVSPPNKALMIRVTLI